MTAAFIFPGQGSQAVGMGKALAEAFPAARAVFDEVDAALGEKLTAIMWDGPAETLHADRKCPAGADGGLAGHAARAGDRGRLLDRTRRRLRRRPFARRVFGAGRRRQPQHRRYRAPAAHPRPGHAEGGAGRASAPWRRCSALDYEAAVAVAGEAAQGEVCEAANDNGGGQVVLSGDKAAVERALEIAKAKGARRAMLLPVSAPFHCALMQPAADAMAEALAGVTIRQPASPLVSNVLAAPITDPDEIRRRLIEQVTGTVRWRESVAYMAGHGVTRFFEIGTGKVLSGLVKRIADGAVGISIGGPDDIAAAKDAIAAAHSA